MNDQQKNHHDPVLLNEVVEALQASSGGIFLDCTFGGGGHTKEIFKSNANNFVYALDCDPYAKQRAQVFSQNHTNFRFYQMNFSEIDCLHLPPVDGILMDLGISSFQIDDEERGFSFRYSTTLDMRMDNTRGMSAAEFLRTATERDLIVAIRDYGEEERWKKIVRSIIEHRKNIEIWNSSVFAKLIADCTSKCNRQRINPATKTFQGIRIFINNELENLEKALPLVFDQLKIGGRLAVISFHSLEDRIVKRFFNKMAGKPIHRLDTQSQQDRMAYAEFTNKKPITPNESEIYNNPRSRSAKLRVLQKICNI